MSIVVCRLHYINTLKQELDGTRGYQETDSDKMSVVNAHLKALNEKVSVCVSECQDKLPTMYISFTKDRTKLDLLLVLVLVLPLNLLNY